MHNNFLSCNSFLISLIIDTAQTNFKFTLFWINLYCEFIEQQRSEDISFSQKSADISEFVTGLGKPDMI